MSGVAAGVAFFVVTTVQENRLLDRATATNATVVGVKGSNGINPFDFGRLIVRYGVANRTYTRTIWLDDVRSETVGDTLSVLYDPANPGLVRTEEDANSPVPLGGWVMVGGLLSLGAAVVGGLLLKADPAPERRRRRQELDEFGSVPDGLLAAGVVLGVALTVLVFVHDGRRDAWLMEHGRSTKAVVVDSGSGGRHAQDWVELSFTAGDRPVSGRLHGIDADNSREGDLLEVYYDPENPKRFRTAGFPNHSNLDDSARTFLPTLTGLGLAVLAGRRLGVRRQR